MKNIKKNATIMGMLLILFCGSCSLTFGAKLTASTSLTIVHITEFKFNSADTTQWGGDWPNAPDDAITPTGQELYLNNVHFTPTHMSWETTPYKLPYPVFPNAMTGMVAAIWSLNRGKTYILGSWDYLRNTAHAKGIEKGMPDCWMGTMVHSICDRKAGECNGRNRSNVFFTEYPAGNSNCWGSDY